MTAPSQPLCSGVALLDEMTQTPLSWGAAALWWLGQSGYALKTAQHLLYFDPYLSDHLAHKYAHTAKPHTRLTAAPLQGEQITNADWVFISHRHSDHLDPVALPQILRAAPQARVVLPAAILDYALSLGLPRERLHSTRGDETLVLDGLTVQSIPAAHPTFEQTPTGEYPFVGYGVAVDGLRCYHSGDTLVYDGLAERLRAFQPHIACLPINGRNGGAGTPPNMDAAEAVALARAADLPLVIPGHYDMFAFNTGDVQQFAAWAQAAQQPYRVLRCGERCLVRGSG